tara:strand:- start:282 stop:737 length:456 start_codon:yes stop_codon:yes gene_type:complete
MVRIVSHAKGASNWPGLPNVDFVSTARTQEYELSTSTLVERIPLPSGPSQLNTISRRVLHLEDTVITLTHVPEDLANALSAGVYQIDIINKANGNDQYAPLLSKHKTRSLNPLNAVKFWNKHTTPCHQSLSIVGPERRCSVCSLRNDPSSA